jgi:hypothetical protein
MILRPERKVSGTRGGYPWLSLDIPFVILLAGQSLIAKLLYLLDGIASHPIPSTSIGLTSEKEGRHTRHVVAAPQSRIIPDRLQRCCNTSSNSRQSYESSVWGLGCMVL